MNNRGRFQLVISELEIAPNIWDVVVLAIILGTISVIAWGASQMATPYQVGQTIPISLDPKILPKYAVNTVLRMVIAMLFSLLFTLIVAPLAAKSRTAGKFIIPFIDIMQSIPVLGMLSITVSGFISLFPNSLLGPESAAIFAIFTAQVWNIVLSLYQSLITVPHSLQEASRMYQLSAWQRFWRVEIPFGTQGLLWNVIMSMSAGWFFVVLSETIVISNQTITLPGIGSYISKAIIEKNLLAMGYAIITMFLVIILYDQLLFRPLLAWAEKFTVDHEEHQSSSYQSWFFDLLTKTKLLKLLEDFFGKISDIFINKLNILFKKRLINTVSPKTTRWFFNCCYYLWQALVIIFAVGSFYFLMRYIYIKIQITEMIYVVYLGAITSVKVIALILLASVIWIPIGVKIGLNKKMSVITQPIIQVLAAFPANFFYPLAVILIIRYNLNETIWTTPLMILGTQWYILFNVIAAVNTIPKDIILATDMLKIRGWLWWRKVMLPAIFPYYVTGAMTAAGGCWNASIVAEVVSWGEHTISSLGLGYYITKHAHQGDFPRLSLGIAVMCLYVLLFNRLLWQKLYQLAIDRFNLN